MRLKLRLTRSAVAGPSSALDEPRSAGFRGEGGPRTDGLIQDFGRFPISSEPDGDGLLLGSKMVLFRKLYAAEQ
jgi:hypothetical protein